MLVIEWFCTGMKVTHVLLRILYIHYTEANVTSMLKLISTNYG